ncbi:HIT family protein [Sphaerisporangium aureirubrum]|uniref:HIT family protein n=1 Tax=Sphaerisporangium aureirubrum TaxID=1544736 RepID=A0ABW1NLL6_9ACTN
MTDDRTCPYCDLGISTEVSSGEWVHRDEFWLVQHGPLDTSRPGTVKIVSRRHYIDFADMTSTEAASFGHLLNRLDIALRATTDAERVHLVSTRDRVQHFHAWLYPRPASHPLRGTDFLNAPQTSDAAQAEHAAQAIRHHLATQVA